MHGLTEVLSVTCRGVCLGNSTFNKSVRGVGRYSPKRVDRLLTAAPVEAEVNQRVDAVHRVDDDLTLCGLHAAFLAGGEADHHGHWTMLGRVSVERGELSTWGARGVPVHLSDVRIEGPERGSEFKIRTTRPRKGQRLKGVVAVPLPVQALPRRAMETQVRRDVHEGDVVRPAELLDMLDVESGFLMLISSVGHQDRQETWRVLLPEGGISDEEIEKGGRVLAPTEAQRGHGGLARGAEQKGLVHDGLLR